MTIPMQITFRGVEPSDALRTSIEKHAAKLERFSKAVLACHVVVEPAEKHHHRGNRYYLHVHLKIPGRDIQAGRRPALNARDPEDLYVAVRDVFDAARRQLEDYERLRRHDVKAHQPAAHGQVMQIYKDADYGIIRTPEGRDVHFHRHSVVDGEFDRLMKGDEIRFHEVLGDQGPWASTVHLVGKQHSVV